MTVCTQSIPWNSPRPLEEIFNEAQHNGVDFVIAEATQNPTNVPPATTSFPIADVVCFRDAFGTKRWSRLSRSLSAKNYFLAVKPSVHPAIAISVPAVIKCSTAMTESRSLNELVVQLSDTTTFAFVDDVKRNSIDTFAPPQLTFENVKPGQSWVREAIQDLSVPGKALSPTAFTCLRSGLYLLNDFFDESHSQSQSIEGLGANRTGDYWHAILHRREPDYGNAKYWFRLVGRHPIFPELAQKARYHMNEAAGPLVADLEPWQSRLIVKGNWDPLAFIDLCSNAERNVDLRRWCELVQYDEMLLLLESTVNMS